MTQERVRLRDMIFSANELVERLEGRFIAAHEKVALKFLENIISNSDAVLLLINNDFDREAAAVNRIAIEHLINLAALIKKPEHLDTLLLQGKNDIAKTLRMVTDEDQQSGAEEAPDVMLLGSRYDSAYRELSATYAHSTIASISTHPDGAQTLENMTKLITLGIGFLENSQA
ncbi:hypothetical protein K5Q02_15780 [Pseudomonas sp. MM211]|uniref:DUF5677 domain-containing protein n=1 Tax=Pseudomonas sp. MM211 TaxID=2866808 RepID=UPI001CEDFC42|nr:DUF5677 domain-containing protein [Pseudomonas sp. MM211]UCJ15315.1 hypothetical protein K5Q02_15780 [Pseudomonas sp. MM211]